MRLWQADPTAAVGAVAWGHGTFLPEGLKLGISMLPPNHLKTLRRLQAAMAVSEKNVTKVGTRTAVLSKAINFTPQALA